jgi:protein-L-isoaspartate(D-aspartate) O-methyltransferase
MSKESLIQSLVNEGYLKTPIIIEAFQKIDRKDFVIDKYKDAAYFNEALPIGEGQTISQPLTVAFMLELLEPCTGEKILDIGTGSGWQAALLSYIISKDDREKKGKVVAIERIHNLKKMAENNLAKYGFIEKEITEVIEGNAAEGYEREAPYNKIIAAASGQKIPETWKEQIAIGGRIVAPIDFSIYVLDKIGKNEFKKRQYFGFSFVPLIQED